MRVFYPKNLMNNDFSIVEYPTRLYELAENAETIKFISHVNNKTELDLNLLKPLLDGSGQALKIIPNLYYARGNIYILIHSSDVKTSLKLFYEFILGLIWFTLSNELLHGLLSS